MVLDVYEIIAIAGAAVAYLIGALHFLQLAWVWLRSPRPRRGSLAKWAAKVRAWALGRSSQQESGLDTKIRCLIERERTKCILTFAQPFAHFSALFLVSKMIVDVAYAVAPVEAEAVQARFEPALVSRIMEVLLLFILCKLVVTFPRYVTSRAASIVFVLFCALEVAKSLALLSVNHLLIDAPFVQAFAFFLGVIACDSRVTVPCLIASRLVLGIFLRMHAKRAVEGDVLDGMEDRILMQYISLALGQSLTLVCLESAVWAASREVLEVKAASKTGRTVQKIISALCDAVVTLGPDLRINKRAPKLANLLLQGNPVRALEGSSFTDLLLETDKVRFLSFLERILHAEDEEEAEGADEPTPAQALQVSLRDSTGTAVQVQLFHSRFRDESDEIGHLLGICEVGDAARGQALCARREEPGRAPGSVTWADGGSDTDSGSESSSTLGGISVTSRRARKAAAVRAAARRAVGSTSHGLLQSTEEPGEEEAPAPWQLLQPGECGVAIQSLRFQVGGSQRTALPAIDASLADHDSLQLWVAEWPSCRAWIQDLTNAALRPIKASSWRDPSNPPAYVRVHVALQATCAIPQGFLERSIDDGQSSQPAAELQGVGAAGKTAPRPPMRLPLDSVKLLKSAPRAAPRPGERSRGQQRRQPAGVQPAVIGAAGPRSSGSSSRPPRNHAPDGAAAPPSEGRPERAAAAVCPYVCL